MILLDAYKKVIQKFLCFIMSSHLSLLIAAAEQYADRPAFRIPVCGDWHRITFRQLLHDVELYSKHWRQTLKLPLRSVVGVWLGGYTYLDLVHVYALSRAGYVPQLFSLRLPSPEVVFELLIKANAKALLFDASFQSVLADCPIPSYPACPVTDATHHPLPPMPPTLPDDIAFIFHTSGSTSGSPKLVPCTYHWIRSAITKSSQICRPRNPNRQDVTTWMGSILHIGTSFMLLGSLQHGTCTVQPTSIPFSASEFVDMIERCGLNRLNQFAAFLAKRIREARHDRQLLSLLTNLDEVLYSGMPLAREEEEFALKNGIRLRCLFGSTEVGATLSSSDGNTGLLRPLEGTSYAFVPVDTAQEANHTSTARMLEFVVLAGSPDCPHPSLRAADGHFHTGDLFQESAPGSSTYIFRGRDDDWIKSENSLRCDTRAIEDNARAMCGTLISDCIVVGAGRPSPVMLIETLSDMAHEKLKKEIIRQTRPFHQRRYLHERIASPKFIVVLPVGTLPRTATKGNIRRKAVEEMFRSQLDLIYSS